MELPAAQAAQIGESQLPSGENIYAGNDLADLAASLEGIGKLTALLRTVVAPVDPKLDADLGAAQAAAEADLAALKQDAGFPAYGTVSPDERAKLAADMAGLAQALDRLPAVIGVN